MEILSSTVSLVIRTGVSCLTPFICKIRLILPTIGLRVKNRNRTNEFCKKCQINIRHSLLNYTEVMYFARETGQNSCVSLARIYLFIWREVKGDNFYFAM